MSIGLHVPTRIVEDITKKDGRDTQLFLRNSKEKIDSINKTVTTLQTQVATLQGQVKNQITNVFSKSFVSALNPIVYGTVITLLHSLGDNPKSILSTLVNMNTEFGYAVGEEVPFFGAGESDGTVVRFREPSISSDKNNIYVIIPVSTSGIYILRKDVGQIGNTALITLANWNVRVKAWA